MTPYQHRAFNTIFTLVLLIATVAVMMQFKHDMHGCEDRLFEKLTKQKAPKIKDEL